jgi:hypothetical protein
MKIEELNQTKTKKRYRENMKKTCKISGTPSKGQWEFKKDKRYKLKGLITYSGK